MPAGTSKLEFNVSVKNTVMRGDEGQSTFDISKYNRKFHVSIFRYIDVSVYRKFDNISKVGYINISSYDIQH